MTSLTPHVASLNLSGDFDARRQAHFKALEAMNARFYQRFATSFHQTRGYGWPGWRALLKHLPPRALSVYDIACGNGRLTELLTHVWCAEQEGGVEGYLGVDRDQGLLAHARERTRPFPCHWSQFNWSSDATPPEMMICGGADWVTLFGVMHHVYSFSARVALVCWAAQFLRPDGALSVSLWDFGAQPRYHTKRLAWSEHAHDGVALELVEEGDALLGWRGETDTPRYCHWMSPDEESRWLEQIATRAPQLSPPRLDLHPRDGNRYWTWRRRS